MKKELSTIELRFIIKELSKYIIHSKVDRVYQIDKKDFIIQLYAREKGRILLRLSQRFIWLTSEKPEIPQKTSGFCSFLRKYLEGMIIDEISQHMSERIVKISLSNKENKISLITELFSLGNIIVVDNKKIIGAFEQIDLKDRKIKTGEIYKFPKSTDIFDLSYNDFKKLVKIEYNISKTLATKLGIGGIYAEELCLRSNIDKKSLKLNENELKSLFKNFKEMIKTRLKPSVVYDNDFVKDIVPFELNIYKDFKQKSFDNYNQALDHILKRSALEEKKEKVDIKYKQKIEKIKTIIKAQKNSLVEQENISEQEKAKAEYIYENYQFFDQIIKQLKDIRKRYSWNDIKDKLKGHKFIKEIVEKNNEVIIEK